MGTPVAYLAGPMFSVPRDQAEGWREVVRQEFKMLGIESISPTYRWSWPAGRIVRADLRDIQRATFLLAYVPLEVPMYGTPIELFYAYAILKKPVYAFGHEMRKSSPWIVMHTTCVTANMQNALQHIRDDLIELRKLAGE